MNAAPTDTPPDAWTVQVECRNEPSFSAVRDAVFADPLSRRLLAVAQRVAATGVTALLAGPTGSGKEVLARFLHDASPRRRGPFIAVNCAALPESLIESQLFGHEKGAFTGACRSHAGVFEQAHGGTLFLDEIGDMPLQLQSRLLRVLQDRQVQRLGAEQAHQLDVRLIVATHQDLRQAIVERSFREDLYYRIATFRLNLLPLVDRPGDIWPLALHFLSQQPTPSGVWRVTDAVRQRLLAHAWPGNVRELQNVLHRATVLSEEGWITEAQLMFDDQMPDGVELSLQSAEQLGSEAEAPNGPLPDDLHHEMPAAVTPSAATGLGLQEAVKRNEQELILQALALAPSRTEAARRLGISPRTLRYKLAQLREQAASTTMSQEGVRW